MDQNSAVCHYWHFLNKGFKFQPNVCNRFHDLLMMAMNLSDIANLDIKGSNYGFIVSGISKNEAISLMKNAEIFDRSPKIAEHYKT